MLRIAAAAVLAILPLAAKADQLSDLWAAMEGTAFVQVLSEEGKGHAVELEDELFPGRGGPDWAAQIDRIYAPHRMEEITRAALEKAIRGKDIGSAIAFYQDPLGVRVIRLELDARRALLDPAVEDASYAEAERMIAERDPRVDLIAEYAEASDLIESNVVGALNSNYAFMLALAEGGQGPFAEDTGQVLAEVWAQEQDIRADTQGWVVSYFSFAYEPLADAELQDLIAFSRTAPGQAVNRAMFAAFDVLFTDISAQLGQAAAEMMSGEAL